MEGVQVFDRVKFCIKKRAGVSYVQSIMTSKGNDQCRRAFVEGGCEEFRQGRR